MKRILQPRRCVLGCGWEDDELEHYVCCSFFWNFIRKQRPQGLGMTTVPRHRDSTFLLAPQLDDDDAIRMAAGLYALHRTVNHICFSGPVRTAQSEQGTMRLLKAFCRRALEGSDSRRLLLPLFGLISFIFICA